jgi:hypothetical protein
MNIGESESESSDEVLAAAVNSTTAYFAIVGEKVFRESLFFLTSSAAHS